MNDMPKYVVSTTLEDPEWSNTSVMRDVNEVAGLKEQEGGPILLAGSRTLVHGLMELGLVDEFRLMTFPVVLGSGARVFPETPDKTQLELVGYAGVRLRRCRAHLPHAGKPGLSRASRGAPQLPSGMLHLVHGGHLEALVHEYLELRSV